MWIRHVCRSCSLIFSIVIPYLWTWIGQRKSLWFVEFIHLVSLRRIVVLCFHSLNVGNGRNTWVCWWFSRTVSTGINWLTPWAVHIYVHIHVVVGHWIGLESILILKGNNVFASSLLGATIQDGGTRERSDVPWFFFFFNINNLLHGTPRQTVVATFITMYRRSILQEN